MPRSDRITKKREREKAQAASSCKSIRTFFGHSTRVGNESSADKITTTTTSTDGETETTGNDIDRPDCTSTNSSGEVTVSKSKHSEGTKSVLQLQFEWIDFREEWCDKQKKNTTVLYCKLCKKTNSLAPNGGKTWVSEGFRSLHRDRVKDHANSAQHKEAIRREKQLDLNASHSDNDMDRDMSVAERLMHVLLYLVRNNLPLDQFGGLVDLCIDTGAVALTATRQACNATYTSPQTVHELLSSLSETIDDHLLADIQSSKTYALMMDEVCDKSGIKNLGVVIKYIDKMGVAQMRFLHDCEMSRSTGEDIKKATLDTLTLKSLNPASCTNLTSDGASSFAGKRNGAAALLKEGGLKYAVVMHCHDHRLALAFRDAFNEIRLLDSVSEFLDSLYKYYKYSSVSAATLRQLQDVYSSANWRIQQAKHHRWLSYDKAVLAVLKGLHIITEDLGNVVTSAVCGQTQEFTKQRKTDATALHKWLTEEKTVRVLSLLAQWAQRWKLAKN